MTVAAVDHLPVPGTIHLVDSQHNLQLRHASGNNEDVVLVPRPTNDPEDPLNWSKRRKLLSVFSMAVYMMMTGISVSLMYSIIVPVSNDTGLTVADLNAGTGYSFLSFGWGCLIWQPAALQFGKRPIYLLSLLLGIVSTVCVPFALSPGPWMAMKVLSGFVGAPLESLGEISIADVFFTHERGAYLGVYSFTLWTAGFIAPTLAGFIEEGMGWRWVQYWGAIWLAMGLVFCFFFLEETNYDRSSVLNDERHTEENLGHITVPTEELESVSEMPGNQKVSDTSTTLTAERTNTAEYPRKTFVQKLKLFGPQKSLRHFPSMVIRPLRLMRFPIVVYCGFSYGASLIWYSVLNATASVILSSEPYNFTPSQVGLAYIACIVGVLIGCLAAGPFGDWAVLQITRRNKGVWESEHRQWLNLILAVVVPFSLLLWGLGAHYQVHWFGLVFAMGLTGVAVAMGAHLSISYCIDTYKDFGADVVVSTIIIRNTMGFAMGYGVTPWVNNMGYQNAFITGAIAGSAQVLLCLVFIKWGKQIRQHSAVQYHKEVARAEELGIAH